MRLREPEQNSYSGAMTNQSITALARELDRQLQSGQDFDPADRALLEQLRRDIQSILDTPPDAAKDMKIHPDILDRLREATNHFETTHPVLTATMAQVSSTLSNMGI